MPRSGSCRSLALAVAVAVAALTVAACTGGAREDAARAAAEELARALSARDIGAVAIEGGGQPELAAVLKGAGGTPAQVSVSEVSVTGDRAAATLDWTWDTAGQNWAYQTTAELGWADGSWRTQWNPSLVAATLVPGESLQITREQAERGNILGAGGIALVKDRKVVRYGIDRTRVPAAMAPESARALANLVGIDPGAYAKQVKAAGPKAFVPAVVLRAGDAADISPGEVSDIPGARAIPGRMPLAPTRTFAAALLGRVGPATAEIVADSKGAVKPGDIVGLSGLQARYEQLLGGSPGEVVRAVSAKPDQAPRELFASTPVPGRPLVTTLDPRIQQAAESALGAVKPASAIVALRPSTGEILAAASGPGSRGRNTATAGRYPPGSTMKVVTTLALLRAGMSLSDSVDCSARLVVDGKPFKNYDGYPSSQLGATTLLAAVANSCNTALISQRAKLGPDDLAQAAAALGLGVDHDLGFPAYFGQVPPADSRTASAAAMIGQGRVLASPMAMAAVAASVAAGRAVVPKLLPATETTEVPPERPLTAKEARALREVMRAVVTQGTAGFLADVPGPAIGAKTGTAEFGTREPLQTHVWMIAHQGDLAVAAFVEVGESGSRTVGPILERFLREVG